MKILKHHGPPGIAWIAICMCLAVCSPKAAAQTSRPTIAPVDMYRMELAVDPTQASMEGKLSLQYRNVSPNPLPAVRLRLDPNISSRQSLDIIGVQDADGQALQWSFMPAKFGNSNSEKGAIEITLPRAIPPAGETTLSIQFRSSGNHIRSDMVILQDDPYHSLDAWYPKAMSRRDGDWSIDDDRLGDYDVTVKMPAAYVVASTGRRTGGPLVADGQSEMRLQASSVRGFSILGDPRWRRIVRQAGKVELAVFLPEDALAWADRMLDTTADAIAFYEGKYGPFPGKHMDIVCPGTLSARPEGSSAACNIIMVFLSNQMEQQYRFLIAHEVAHQYWGVQVGFPRDSIGWVPIGLGMMMDEDYMLSRGLDARWGRGMMRDFYFRAEQMGFDTTLSQSVRGPLTSPPPWTSGWNLALMHGKAYAACAMLRDLLGPERFQGVIRTVIHDHAGGIVRENDLIAACESALGEKLDWFVADWINGRAKFDYAIRSVQKAEGGWNVEVARVGTGSFPAQIELTTEDGQKFRQRVDRTNATEVLKFKTAGAVQSVRLNPEGFYPDLNAADDVWPRAQTRATTRPQ